MNRFHHTQTQRPSLQSNDAFTKKNPYKQGRYTTSQWRHTRLKALQQEQVSQLRCLILNAYGKIKELLILEMDLNNKSIH